MCSYTALYDTTYRRMRMLRQEINANMFVHKLLPQLYLTFFESETKFLMILLMQKYLFCLVSVLSLYYVK